MTSHRDAASLHAEEEGCSNQASEAIKTDELLKLARRVLLQLESALPMPAAPPDWDKGRAFRWCRHPWYGSGTSGLQPSNQLSRIRLDDLQSIDEQKIKCWTTPTVFSPAGRPTTCCLPEAVVQANLRWSRRC